MCRLVGFFVYRIAKRIGIIHGITRFGTRPDKLQGRAKTILAQRDAKLSAAREARKARRNAS